MTEQADAQICNTFTTTYDIKHNQLSINNRFIIKTVDACDGIVLIPIMLFS